MSMVEVQGHLANARAAEEEALARKVRTQSVSQYKYSWYLAPRYIQFLCPPDLMRRRWPGR
jgi:hypothetical protein